MPAALSTPSKSGPAGSPGSAAAASPGLSATRSFLAMRVPFPAKTGNQMIDDEAMARRECFMTIIDECSANSGHILPLFNELNKRMRAMAKEVRCEGAKFDVLAKTFAQTDEEFMIRVVVEISDLSLQDVVKAKQMDDGAVFQLMQFALQYPKGLKYPEEARVVEVLSRVFKTRIEVAGQRLKKFKQNGGVSSTGMLCWKVGCFVLKSIDGLLSEVGHANGDKEPPMPPVLLCEFFKASRTGPYKITKVTSSSKDFAKEVLNTFNAHKNELEAVVQGQGSSSSSSSAGEVRGQLKTLVSEKKKKAMQKARQSAAEKMAE
ncbi:unnamed protein product, partial [Prorocentrum cordatum]